MAKDNSGRQHQLRQLVAQHAARMMAEDGISDYAYAKRKAGRQLGVLDANCLPTNTEIEEEIRLFHEIYNSDSQPQALRQLRSDALVVMQLLERFNPHLTGSVLDGTAGSYAETHIHLFADSLKDVEIFLLNQQIPYESDEKSYRIGNERRSHDRKGQDRKKVPVFTLDGPNGLIKLSIFELDDIRVPTKNKTTGSNATKANTKDLQELLAAESVMAESSTQLASAQHP
ncbi:hypothetical protein A7981_01425 [Methylovorus sp. MM2]|uniref:hypothetical protein n=1 Tax=Methylovorus sp. MM2 TaxID=1848038 RepID=UPI0007DF1F15|nr:hypothetical protein [Methylovorus sp. MM2]OAM52177.1 hypothetical protein A7981_01425 [Methylovorus sp. MM2]